MTKALLFDIDGVVLDSESARDDITKKVLKEEGHEYDRDSLKPLMAGKDNLGCMQILVEAYGLEVSAETLAERKLVKLQELYGELVNFVPGFLEFYSAIRGQKEVAAVTGLDANLFALADARLGLRALFEGRVYNTDLIGKPKPDPEVILTAARQLEVDPKECVVFEDAPNGIAAALRADARVVALTRTFSRITLEQETRNIVGRIPRKSVLFVAEYNAETVKKVDQYLRAV